MRIRDGLRALTAVALATGFAIGATAGEADAQSGPRIIVDRPSVAPGEPLLVTFEGFEAPFVNVVVCGNLAYRGATDCNVTAGVSKETLPGGRPKVVQLIAHPPPVHCPCLVRATASSGDTFAVAPIELRGHPIADVVGVPGRPLIEIEVDAAEANDGFWSTVRSALGGPTRYEATVTVRNTTTQPLGNVVLSGSIGHWSDDDAAELDLEPPGPLEPGQSSTQVVDARVSAPSIGSYRFEVVGSNAGATVAATTSVPHRPWLLYVFAVVLAMDLAVVVARWLARRRADDDDGSVPLRDGPGADGGGFGADGRDRSVPAPV